MEKFSSQICTTREQSKRLIALGLKPETADMLHSTIVVLDNMVDLISAHVWIPKAHVTDDWFPAWSLHRLIEMMPNEIRKYDSIASLIVSNVKVQYYLHDVEYSKYLKSAGLWKEGNTYDNLISCIEWLIKEGYFPKEYLV